MIVRCPSCSTHYRHPDGVTARQARCSRCEAVFFPTPVQRQYVVARAAGVGAGVPVAPAETFRMDDSLTMSVVAREAAAPGESPVPVAAPAPTPVTAAAVAAPGPVLERPEGAHDPLPHADLAPPVAADAGAAEWDGASPDLERTSDDPTTAAGAVVTRAAAAVRDLGLPPGLMDERDTTTDGDEPAPRRERPSAGDARLTAAPVRRPLLEALVTVLLAGLGAAGLWYSAPTMRSIDVGDPAWNGWLRTPEPLHWAAIGGAFGLLVAWAVVRWMAGRR